MDNAVETTRYTRQASNCHYVDDEHPDEVLSDTPFESELLQFDQSLKDARQRGIVFYGSSSIRLWSSLHSDFSHLPAAVINRGFGGSSLGQCGEQFKRVILPLDPRVLIVYAGENDIAADRSPAVVRARFQTLMSTTRRFFPSLPVVFISIKPSPSRLEKLQPMNETNYLIKADIARMANVHYVDIFHEMLGADGRPRPELFLEDDLHMNEQGYAIWTRTLNQYLSTNGLVSKGFNHGHCSFLSGAFSLLMLYLSFAL